MDLSFAAFYSTGLSRKMANSKSRARSKRLVPFPVFCSCFFRYVCQFQFLLLCLYLSWGSLMLTCDFENISSRITPLEESFLWVSICPFDQGVTYCKFYHRGKMDLRVCLTFQVTFPEILREREVSTFTRNGGQCQHPLTPAGAVRRTGPTQMLGLGEHRECPCTQMGKPTPAHGKLASSVDYLPST